MKFHKVLQPLSLMLILIIGGQEIMHKLFHLCSNSLPCRYQRLSPERPELKSTGHNYPARKAHVKIACHMCNSAEDRLAPDVSLKTEITDCGVSVYTCPQNFSAFSFFTRPVSRGPPSA